MPSFSHWTDQDVLFKIVSVGQAMKGTIRQADAAGVWMTSPDLAVVHGQRTPAARNTVINDAIFYVPMSQIEWVMSADPGSQPSSSLG